MKWLTLGLFCAALLACLALDASILIALAFGLLLFLLYGRRRGFAWDELLCASLSGCRAADQEVAFMLNGGGMVARNQTLTTMLTHQPCLELKTDAAAFLFRSRSAAPFFANFGKLFALLKGYKTVTICREREVITMKRKLISGILTLVLLFSASVPAYAADSRTGRSECRNELLEQILCRYTGSCGTAAEQRIDRNALLRRWLARTPAEAEQPAESEQTAGYEQPAVPEQPAAPESPAESDAPATVDTSARAYEREVVRLVNAERAKHGLAALTEDESLSALARRKSQDMHDHGYFDHDSPTYGSPFRMMKSFGFSYRTAGENIAMGYRTPAAVVDAWMNSPGHRANILNASYTTIGVGYVAAGNYWTQEFIG